MDLDQIQMRKAIDQSGAGHFADTTKVIGVNRVDVLVFELHRTSRNGVEHLIVPIQEMHRAQNKIQLVPMLFDPFAAGGGMDWIVVQFDTSADSQIGISFPQAIDFTKIDSGVVTIMIREGDIFQA